jgi:ATP/ADP translocase
MHALPVQVFMGFFTVFAFVLYPNHHLIHPHQLADSFATVSSAGTVLPDTTFGQAMIDGHNDP